jgi:double-strand break repair protein MRE11
MKDRKLNDLLIKNKIVFRNLDTKKFNILLVHQNRIARNKEYVRSSLFPLIVYEPMIVKDRVTILQSGSTVRTSLCDDEHNIKYTYILEHNQLYKIALNSVRKFVFDSLSADSEKDVINKIEMMLSSTSIKNNNSVRSSQ